MMKPGLIALLFQPFAVMTVAAGCGAVADCTLGGMEENVLLGTHTIRKGVLAMAKPDGVTAIAGNIIVGGGANLAVLRWDASHQVADSSSITLIGPQPAHLLVNGHTETLGVLILSGDGEVRLGAGSAVVQFAASSLQTWTAGSRLVIHEWDGLLAGGGNEAVLFGTSTGGLTAGQVTQLGFMDPAGLAPGLYPATILPTGEVVPVSSASAFDLWAFGKGLTGEAAGFPADPDGDRIPNGVEYALGGEPNPAHPGSNSQALLPTAAVLGNNFVFTFTRMHEAAYLNPVVEFDADLQGEWTTAVDPENAGISITPGTSSDIVTVTLPQGENTGLFVRLKVAIP